MPTPPAFRRTPSRRSVLLALVVGALALWGLQSLPLKELTARYDRIFPRDLILFAYDPTGSGDGLRNIERIYPTDKQRHDGLRISVQSIAKAALVGSLDEVIDAVGKSLDKPNSGRLFIQLAPPFRITKKQFRAAVDAQDRYKGKARVDLLRRIYPIIGADEKTPKDSTPCQQFDDDLTYAEDSFGGYALRLDEQTVQLLGECMAETLRAHSVAKL